MNTSRMTENVIPFVAAYKMNRPAAVDGFSVLARAEIQYTRPSWPTTSTRNRKRLDTIARTSCSWLAMNTATPAVTSRPTNIQP